MNGINNYYLFITLLAIIFIQQAKFRYIIKLVMIMKFDSNKHSVFLLYYHLILVTKYRRDVIDEKISKRLKEIFEYIQPNYNITLIEWNHDKDSIYVLFKATPTTPLSKFINAYKSASSRLVKKNFLKLSKNYGRNIFGQEVIVY